MTLPLAGVMTPRYSGVMTPQIALVATCNGVVAVRFPSYQDLSDWEGEQVPGAVLQIVPLVSKTDAERAL